jgi:hypothetical protein
MFHRKRLPLRHIAEHNGKGATDKVDIIDRDALSLDRLVFDSSHASPPWVDEVPRPVLTYPDSTFVSESFRI